jgi:NAD(P)-dependent dehydrogenase (short-subunit alcohol dehydrogenase family)
MFDLTGKTALISGACGTLGPVFAEALAEFGANIVLSDIKPGAAMKLADNLSNKYGVQAIGMNCDVADKASVEDMTKSSVDRFGTIDILLNNAANSMADPKAYFAPFEEYSTDEWRRVLGVDLDGMFLVAQAVGSVMVESGRGGSIIQTASVYAAYAADNRIYEGARFNGVAINNPAVYAVGKAGVLGLTRWLATYWADHGIRVNSLLPGGVEADQNDEFKKQYSNRVPLGRMARKTEIAGAVIWLASEASSYVTGQSIFVDGGLSAW